MKCLISVSSPALVKVQSFAPSSAEKQYGFVALQQSAGMHPENQLKPATWWGERNSGNTVYCLDREMQSLRCKEKEKPDAVYS